MKANSFKVTMMIPLQDNDGNQFDMSVWDWWDTRLFDLIDGLTNVGNVSFMNVVTGQYKKGQPEKNKWIYVIVKNETEVEKFRQLLLEARLRFKQDAMYFECERIYYEDLK